MDRAVATRSLTLLAVLVVAACGGPGGASPSTPPPTTSRTAVSVQPPSSTPLAEPPAEPAGSGLRATIATSLGEIQVELFDRSAPVATENFVNLARAGFYDGVVFHRLVPGFVIQGGDPDGTGRGGPGYTIRDEPVVGQYARGIVAMARTPAPDSQGSQFFVILDDQARRSLDIARTYVIFGRVTAGMDVVDRIAAMPNSGEPENRALQPVAMDRVTISGP